MAPPTTTETARPPLWTEKDAALAVLCASGLDADRVHLLFDEVGRRTAQIEAQSPHGPRTPRHRALLSVYRDVVDGLL